jgi:hypothetical protein
MKGLCFAVLLTFSSAAFSAFERTSEGSRAVAMGGGLVALRGSEWSAFANPAALKTVGARTLALFYAPQIFELKELSHAAASYIEPTAIGTFAISASRFGLDFYKESRVAVSYSEEVASTITLGVGLDYYSLSIQNYGSAGTFGVDIGVLMEVADGVHWGFAAFNLNAPRIGTAQEKLPQVFSTGIAYSPFNEATLSASIRKDVRYAVELRVGVEYEFIEMIAVRAGTSSEPSALNAGTGIHYLFARLDYAFTWHTELGISHQFSLSLNLGDF